MRMEAYIICAVFCCIGGLLQTLDMKLGRPETGDGWEFRAIAGCVVGGVSLSGGKGSPLGILIGGTTGTLLRSKINHKLVDCLMTAMGLVVVSVGVQGIVGSTDTMCLVLCLAIGAIIGQALRIDEFIDSMGVRVAKLFEGKKFAEGRFADGVISASVMFTVGAMAIMGSLDAGLRGNYSVLFTKTAIDGVAAAAMSAAMGIGVVLSLVPVLIWEGLLILLAGALAPILSTEVVAEISAVGGAIFIGMGLNMIGITDRKVNVPNLLPALVLPIIYVPLASWIGGLL